MARGGKSYLLIDNRCSGGGVQEYATATCAHCNRVVVLNPLRQRERGYCRKCDAFVCDSAGCNVECNPIEQMVELAQKYPDDPWLLRGPNGEPLFNPSLKDRERIY